MAPDRARVASARLVPAVEQVCTNTRHMATRWQRRLLGAAEHVAMAREQCK
jgi:hypothetical protein